jgi:hypothetical protein
MKNPGRAGERAPDGADGSAGALSGTGHQDGRAARLLLITVMHLCLLAAIVDYMRPYRGAKLSATGLLMT